jgi:hypothetical protein
MAVQGDFMGRLEEKRRKEDDEAPAIGGEEPKHGG